MFTTPTNDERAELAALAINYFGRLTNMDAAGEDEETMFGDLLANMMHWCDRGGVDFDKKLFSARVNYEAEVEEEQP